MSYIKYTPLYSHESNIYELDSFVPHIVDEGHLRALGLVSDIDPETIHELERGSKVLIRKLSDRTLIPEAAYSLREIEADIIEPQIHNYTGRCPTLTYEINPGLGCGVGCLYCLVTDGIHSPVPTFFSNYHLYVRELLEKMNSDKSENRPHYYYFSPKTEALQEPTLNSGIAHRILREFILHFEKNPSSKARLFVASKAGAKHLLIENEGESILDLFERLSSRMQFNTSVSIMPTAVRDLLEPFAAPIEERLHAVRLCRERGIEANSALVQPILTPYLNEENIKRFFSSLREAGIINYKPEFLTVSPENLSILGNILSHFDKHMEARFYSHYIGPDNRDHVKQRSRTAPDRELCRESLQKMKSFTDTLGMSVSICYWVRKELGIDEKTIPIVNRNGFQCLGYQSRLFKDEK